MRGEALTKAEASLIEKSLLNVGLDPNQTLNKYPFELSGGQRQRIMIARAFLIDPKIVIADECTSMIDSVLRSSVLVYLIKLRELRGTTIVFITHDIGLAYYISDYVMIMRKGEIVETGTPEKVIHNPEHEYTQTLIRDVPSIPDLEF